MEQKLKVMTFNNSFELKKWVDTQEKIQIVSITSKGTHEGEGYTIFYY